MNTAGHAWYGTPLQDGECRELRRNDGKPLLLGASVTRKHAQRKATWCVFADASGHTVASGEADTTSKAVQAATAFLQALSDHAAEALARC